MFKKVKLDFYLKKSYTIPIRFFLFVPTKYFLPYFKFYKKNFSFIETTYYFSQFCYECDPTKPEKRHPPEYAVDGLDTWWQSPPLSRGMKYNEVNLTIELGQVGGCR